MKNGTKNLQETLGKNPMGINGHKAAKEGLEHYCPVDVAGNALQKTIVPILICNKVVGGKMDCIHQFSLIFCHDQENNKS